MKTKLIIALSVMISTISYCQTRVEQVIVEETVLDGVIGTTDFTGFTNYRIFAYLSGPEVSVSAIGGWEPECIGHISTSTSFYRNSLVPDITGTSLNETFFEFVPELQYHSVGTIGYASGSSLGIPISDDTDGILDGRQLHSEGGSISATEIPGGEWVDEFREGGNIIWETINGGAFRNVNANALSNFGLGINNTILLGSYTTDGEFSYKIMLGTQIQMNTTFVSECNTPNIGLQYPTNCLGGCTDPIALNFSIHAGCNDGSCVYATGCTNEDAINYDPEAQISDGSCVGCLGDYDENGVVTVSDLSTFLGEFGCTLPSDCFLDLDNDGNTTIIDFSIFLALFGTSCN